jgi:hypothetical protein
VSRLVLPWIERSQHLRSIRSVIKEERMASFHPPVCAAGARCATNTTSTVPPQLVCQVPRMSSRWCYSCSVGEPMTTGVSGAPSAVLADAEGTVACTVAVGVSSALSVLGASPTATTFPR